jgi:hypothetical protein
MRSGGTVPFGNKERDCVSILLVEGLGEELVAVGVGQPVGGSDLVEARKR